MAMVEMHGQAARLTGNDADLRGKPMHVIEADAKFLRAVLAALVFSTIAIGAAAGYAAVHTAAQARQITTTAN